MTQQLNLSVAGLLPDNLAALPNVLRANLQNSGDRPIPALALNFLDTQASSALRSALDTDIFELLAQGWCVARELHKFTDPDLHPPEEKSTVTLSEHRLTATAYPTLTVSVDTRHLPPLRLTLELAATFHTAVLTIQNAHILSLDAGSCSASAQLKYKDIGLHEPLKSQELTLPAKLPFPKPGFPLRRAQPATPA